MVVGTGCGVGGLCLLSFSICVTVFLIDYTPIVSFIFLSNRSGFFFFLEGVGKAASPTPIHYQPTPLSPDGIRCPHICIVCQSCTPTPHPLFEQTRTHELTQINSHKLGLYYDLRIFGTPIAFDKSWISFVMSRSNMGDFFTQGRQSVKSCDKLFFRTFSNPIRKKLSANAEMTVISSVFLSSDKEPVCSNSLSSHPIYTESRDVSH